MTFYECVHLEMMMHAVLFDCVHIMISVIFIDPEDLLSYLQNIILKKN